MQSICVRLGNDKEEIFQEEGYNWEVTHQGSLKIICRRKKVVAIYRDGAWESLRVLETEVEEV